MLPRFLVADETEILNGDTTDVYFKRTVDVLKANRWYDRKVVAEFTPEGLPANWSWAVFAGLKEVIELVRNIPQVELYALPEGSIFRPTDTRGVRVPVMILQGPYGAFCVYETPLLGLICQASGIATVTSRIRIAATKKAQILSFGIRRMHPALAPMIDYYAYLGGCDGVSSIIGAKVIGKSPRGTMPHAIVIVAGDQKLGFKAFKEQLQREGIPFVALVDTYEDEKSETFLAIDAVGDALYAVRLDTPSSRRGDFARLIQEIRWELDLRGYQNVKIFVSGGLDETNIPKLLNAGADGFGVGTSISNAPTINFAMDIVEVEGVPAAKRGKFGGCKIVFRCPDCLSYRVIAKKKLIEAEAEEKIIQKLNCEYCGKSNGGLEPMLTKYVEDGKVIRKLPSIDETRNYVLEQLEHVSL